MEGALIGTGATLFLAIVTSAWVLATKIGNIRSDLAGYKAELAEVRRDVERHEGLHTSAAESREKHGERLGSVESAQNALGKVCDERHGIKSGATV